MLINAASNFIAILLGACLAIANNKIILPHNILSVFFNPEFYDFLLRSAAGGAIGFIVKVGGDLTFHWIKNRKNKGGQDE